MSAHTPGPWTVKFRNDHSCYISMGDPNGNGDHKQFDLTFDDRCPSDVADARLIAAAPEILEALEWLCGIAALRPGHLQDYKAAVSSARAAIAKAKGGAA